MNATVQKRLVRFVVYPAFFSLCFAAMLMLNFPYGALKDRLAGEARKQGVDVAAAELKPVLGGVRATGVALGLFKPAEGKGEPEPLRIDSLEIRPRAFPLGVHVRARLLGGLMDASLTRGSEMTLKLRAKALQLSRLPPEATGNVLLDGAFSLLADLKMDGQDFAKAEGRVAVLGEELLLSKGEVMGFALPRVDVGRLELDLALSGGKARLTTARTTGVDLLSVFEGDIKQARKPAMSTANLTVRFQPDETFLKRNSLISAGLGMAMSKDDEGYYTALIKGPLSSLKFTPQKKSRKK